MLDSLLRDQLLDIASRSIRSGVESGRPESIQIGDFAHELRDNKATFVSVYVNASLRGCVGSLQARRPLVCDVADNAYSAAFRDHRFKVIKKTDLLQMTVKISLLSEPVEMQFTNEVDLISQLNQGVDGLILEEGRNRATFLPVVWESLQTPQEFLQQLKIKAGLVQDYWSDGLKFYRYTTESF